LQKEDDGSYVIVFNSPVEMRSIKQNWFCDLFPIECEEPGVKIFKPNTTYTSRNITDMIKTLSVTEWHCNITEYSYRNHDDYPRLHKEDELLHISFVDKFFSEDVVYKENPKKIMFIPLRESLREIREIILTPLDEKNNKIK
jgi:hypothetical protein